MEGFTFLFCFYTFFSIFTISSAVDSISASRSIADGETIISAEGNFELGFFDPGNSKRYLGIWFKKITRGTVTWVANRDYPLNDTSGVLQLSEQGNLVLFNGVGNPVWSSNTSSEEVHDPVAQLLDTGNFVVSDGESTLWQSFEYIGDTLLAGMKLGKNLVTGHERYLTSWRNDNDPMDGDYTLRFDVNGYPQLFVRKGSVVQSRWGPWNGLRFSGTPHLKQNSIYTYDFVFSEEEIYYKFELVNISAITRLILNPFGFQQRLIWIDRTREWKIYLRIQIDTCDQYAFCGAYGSCNVDGNPTNCACLKGFKPKFPSQWASGDWSKGCIRNTELTCGDGEGFLKIPNIKLPDTSNSWYNKTMNLKECEGICLKKCSCTAYAIQDIRGAGSGCLLWFHELMDIREYTENGQDIYVRMSASELGSRTSGAGKLVRVIAIPILIGMGILGLIYILLKRKRKILKLEEQDLDLELPLFDLSTIADATDDFAENTKIGEGGYGPVYKGVLKDGQEIAVKRLSKESKQGPDEFKNEVLCIAKLQHRNLVKLLGCCIQGEEKILIYEYLSNKSLDSIIFSQSARTAMDWPLQHQIINGIARGLLYLHQDSRLRIIHRDLKASNILLDDEMNPKISDFGLAKSFRGDETEAKTRRVIGTYGYMSPEYVIDGAFSVKSDVFSFGVVLLEIISGTRNRGFNHSEHNLNLLGHVWKLLHERRLKELIDASIMESSNEPQLLRYIQVGLLCVQRRPVDRPTMATVVLMLSSDMTLAQPKEPGFFNERHTEFNSMNHMSTTILVPR